jgi:hypothetical protein
LLKTNSPNSVPDIGTAPNPTGNNNNASRKRGARGQRLIGIFLLGLVLFNFPILALFNVGSTVFGVPVLFAYLFLAWAALILLMYLAIDRVP